ncbi:MAG: Gldg family protein, partial [bacterium]
MTFDPDKMRRLLLGSSDEDPESEEEKKPEPTKPIAHEKDAQKASDKTLPEINKPRLEPEVFSNAKPTVIHTPSEHDIKTDKPAIKSDDPAVKHYEFGREDKSRDRVPYEKSDTGRIERKIPEIKHDSDEPVPPPTPFSKYSAKEEIPTGDHEKPVEKEFHEPTESATIETFAPLRNSLLSDENKSETPAEKKSEKNTGTISNGKNIPVKDPRKNGADQKPKRRPLKPIIAPGPLSLLVLIGGFIAFIGALVTVVMGKGGTESFSLTGIGIALVGIFVIINRRWVRQSLSTRSARYTANVSIAILSLLGILICINFITYRLHYRWDVSAEGLFTLSPQTIKVLSDIDRAGEEVSVIAFVPSGNNFRDEIENLIDKYQYESKNIKFKFVDPDVERELTESKGIDRIPSVLFELGSNSSTVIDIDESHFTSALLAVRESHTRIVEFLVGHGEPDPFADSKSDLGLGAFRKRLELERYEVKLLSIPESDGVPQDTSLLIIVAPERNLE